MQDRIAYPLLLFAGLLVALWTSSTVIGEQLDNNVYDWMFRIHEPKPWKTQTAILGVDELTLQSIKGLTGLREPLARGLELVGGAGPQSVAIDVILSDEGDEATTLRLEQALARVPRLVLACDLLADEKWETPLPRFRKAATAVGHVHAGIDKYDAISRAIPLERHSGHERYWALSLEAFRLARGGETILETPDDLQIGGLVIPARRTDLRRALGKMQRQRPDERMMRIRFMTPAMDPIPTVTLKDLLEKPELAAKFKGKIVFVGFTAQGVVRDRWSTPYSNSSAMPGVEIHANAVETMAQGLFLTDVRDSWQVLLAMFTVVASGLAYRFLPGWQATLAAGVVIAAAMFAPWVFFTQRRVLSFATPVFSAWAGTVLAAAYTHLVVGRRLRKAEADRTRYQQTIHFVTHEMRTPLTAIQGSSELISRYGQMPEEKRKQMAQLITSESQRLGRLIEMFLNVERLSAGQMQLKQENFPVPALVEICVQRAAPVAARKQIQVTVKEMPEEELCGDRELMEYAVYNLLTNAIKYSPKETEVTIFVARAGDRVRIAVQDQGIGMDQKEVRQIFQKFYRTKRAEQSGEVGTGIGLSIVEQIITQHGGVIEVTSRPGQGSCFTLVLPAAARMETKS